MLTAYVLIGTCWQRQVQVVENVGHMQWFVGENKGETADMEAVDEEQNAS